MKNTFGIDERIGVEDNSKWKGVIEAQLKTI